MFKLIKLFVMMALVVWVAAAVSAMTSGVMGMVKSKMPWMKEQIHEKMPMMREKMDKGMMEAEEHLPEMRAKMDKKMVEAEERIT